MGLAAGVACGAAGGGCVVGGVCARALAATNTAKMANVIVCLLMSGLYLHLSKGHDNVERAAEASGRRPASMNPGRLVRMRAVFGSRTFFAQSLLMRSLAALLVVALSTACDDEGPTTPDDPDDDAPTFTETFSGSLAPNGALTFPFNAFARGTATATIASITPDNTVTLGLSMGTWANNACSIVISRDNAFEFAQITGSIGTAGALCLRVYDVGRLTTTTKFTVSVVHP